MSTLQLHHDAKVSGETASSSRIAGLDTLRAVLAVLVVALHAAMPYMLSPFPGLAWPVHDSTPSAWVDAVGWWADSFVMPTFLLLAGFSAAQLMRQKGPREFLSHRTRRILGPLAFGMIVLLPIELYIWLLAWVGQGEVPFSKLRSLKVESPQGDHLWGLSHLWFLEFLFLYSLIGWCVIAFLRCQDQRSFPRIADVAVSQRHDSHRLPAWIIPLLGGLLAGGIMCLWPRVLIGFQHGWLPHPANFLSFGCIFAAGWWLSRRQRAGDNVTTGCEWQAVTGLILFAVALPGLREFASLRDADALAPWTTAIAFGLSGWLSALGWTGVFLKHCNRRPHRAVRYMAEASFWLYLVHHPLVALLHINLAAAAWPSEVKFLIASSAAIALSLAMYECFVRRTRLGILLNGRRSTASPLPPVVEQPATEPGDARRAA